MYHRVKARLQALGVHLVAAISQPGWKIEPRAIHAITRLPFARHRHTGRFGDLVIGEQHITIDKHPAGTLAELHNGYRENRSADLPEPSIPLRVTTSAPIRNGEGVTLPSTMTRMTSRL